MHALKTIVATAVVALGLGPAATAGVQHLTARDDQPAAAPAQVARPAGTITMTTAQLRALLGWQGDAAKAKASPQHDRRQDRSQDRTRDGLRDRDTTHATGGHHIRTGSTPANGQTAHAHTSTCDHADSGHSSGGDAHSPDRHGEGEDCR